MAKTQTKIKEKSIKIFDRKSAVLRQVAKEVALSDIKSLKVKKVIREMKAALATQEDGVAIAAPQIGYSLRIFVVSGKVFTAEGERKEPDMTFINPRLTKVSKKKSMMEEGCLSVRWLYGEVSRHEKATVVAYNEKGEKFALGGTGLIAQIFQHEIDHLDGILFIDKAKNVRDLPPKDK
jgi:peptide deformylase